ALGQQRLGRGEEPLERGLAARLPGRPDPLLLGGHSRLLPISTSVVPCRGRPGRRRSRRAPRQTLPSTLSGRRWWPRRAGRPPASTPARPRRLLAGPPPPAPMGADGRRHASARACSPPNL